ncbi:thioredoxin [Clostridium sp.]|uniref:thioredoxin n=1 Tax=Clostridium sp. TaxID=1506 RepID=UPI0025C2AD07|nr:thioredoxin [Clostridium sp.]MCI9071074.1 thioredoxin [Clostridium sp.]MCI9304545.1 thioredoxin [Clostridium sp.]
MKVIKESEFVNEINDGLVLIDFYADWCGPCKMLTPILEEINKENKDVRIIKVNIDDSRFLASYYQIQSIPTLVLLKNGQFLNKMIGFRPKKMIEELIEKGK